MNYYLAQTSTGDFSNTFTNTQTGSNVTEQNNVVDSNAGMYIVFLVIFYLIIIAISIIDILFKVKAMWRAARLSDKSWFICLFLFNTAGILPIIYLRKNKDRYNQLIFARKNSVFSKTEMNPPKKK